MHGWPTGLKYQPQSNSLSICFFLQSCDFSNLDLDLEFGTWSSCSQKESLSFFFYIVIPRDNDELQPLMVSLQRSFLAGQQLYHGRRGCVTASGQCCCHTDQHNHNDLLALLSLLLSFHLRGATLALKGYKGQSPLSPFHFFTL